MYVLERSRGTMEGFVWKRGALNVGPSTHITGVVGRVVMREIVDGGFEPFNTYVTH
jgi:hypothetical protein